MLQRKKKSKLRLERKKKCRLHAEECHTSIFRSWLEVIPEVCRPAVDFSNPFAQSANVQIHCFNGNIQFYFLSLTSLQFNRNKGLFFPIVISQMPKQQLKSTKAALLVKFTLEGKGEKCGVYVCAFCFHMCSPTYFDPASNINLLLSGFITKALHF
jgi:hypothetical protein